MFITSINNDHIKDIAKLNDKKHRDETGLFLAEGRHLVIEAYRRKMIVELILEQDELFPMKVKNITYVTKNILDKISTQVNSPNIMAVIRKKEEEPIGEKILLTDDIQDPGNLGTIIRSAVAFDFDTIVLNTNTVDLYNPKVLKATQGMIFNINIIMRDLETFIPELKNLDYKIVGTKVTNGKDVKEAKIFSHFALVVGNEGNGIKDSILDLCDEYLFIKMNEACESLNVGVAASILMYEINSK